MLGSARIDIRYDTVDTIHIESRALLVSPDAARSPSLLPQVGYRAYHPEGRNCESQGWSEGCRIQGYFSGDGDGPMKSAPPGAMVDLRVYLPRGWPGKLRIWTQDNLAYPSVFPFRADLKVQDFVGQLDISAESGEVQLYRDPSAHSALNCSREEIAACEEQRWAAGSACACTLFSAVKVRMRGAGDVFLSLGRRDILGRVVGAANRDPDLNSASPVQCSAELECEGFDWCAKRQIQPWAITSADLNNNDLLGSTAGILIDLQSARCQNLPIARDETEYNRASQQLRGHLKICAENNPQCRPRSAAR